jgi:hypothetical protein
MLTTTPQCSVSLGTSGSADQFGTHHVFMYLVTKKLGPDKNFELYENKYCSSSLHSISCPFLLFLPFFV